MAQQTKECIPSKHVFVHEQKVQLYQLYLDMCAVFDIEPSHTLTYLGLRSLASKKESSCFHASGVHCKTNPGVATTTTTTAHTSTRANHLVNPTSASFRNGRVSGTRSRTNSFSTSSFDANGVHVDPPPVDSTDVFPPSSHALSLSTASRSPSLLARSMRRAKEVRLLLLEVESSRYEDGIHAALLAEASDSSRWLEARRSFSQELAEWSLLQYLLDVTDRRASCFWLNPATGSVSLLELGCDALKSTSCSSSSPSSRMWNPPVHPVQRPQEANVFAKDVLEETPKHHQRPREAYETRSRSHPSRLPSSSGLHGTDRHSPTPSPTRHRRPTVDRVSRNTTTTTTTRLPRQHASPMIPLLFSSPYPTRDAGLFRLTASMERALWGNTCRGTFFSYMAKGLHQILQYQRELIGIAAYGLQPLTMWASDASSSFPCTSAQAAQKGPHAATVTTATPTRASSSLCRREEKDASRSSRTDRATSPLLSSSFSGKGERKVDASVESPMRGGGAWLPCFDTQSLQTKLSFHARFVLYGDANKADKQLELACLLVHAPPTNTTEVKKEEEPIKTGVSPHTESHALPPLFSSSSSPPCSTSSPLLSSFSESFTVYDWASLLIEVAQDPHSLIGSQQYPHRWASWAPHW